MELQIEKQKHNELLVKAREEGRGSEDELRQQVQNLKQQQKKEMADFQKQIAENKSRFRETESDLRQEIQNLKKVGLSNPRLFDRILKSSCNFLSVDHQRSGGAFESP